MPLKQRSPSTFQGKIASFMYLSPTAKATMTECGARATCGLRLTACNTRTSTNQVFLCGPFSTSVVKMAQWPLQILAACHTVAAFSMTPNAHQRCGKRWVAPWPVTLAGAAVLSRQKTGCYARICWHGAALQRAPYLPSHRPGDPNERRQMLWKQRQYRQGLTE